MGTVVSHAEFVKRRSQKQETKAFPRLHAQGSTATAILLQSLQSQYDNWERELRTSAYVGAREQAAIMMSEIKMQMSRVREQQGKQ